MAEARVLVVAASRTVVLRLGDGLGPLGLGGTVTGAFPHGDVFHEAVGGGTVTRTRFARILEGSRLATMTSHHTSPVNHSAGALLVGWDLINSIGLPVDSLLVHPRLVTPRR